MLDYTVILFLTALVLGPIAVWSSHNYTNSVRFANKMIEEHDYFCPFKYKWQIADDLSFKQKDYKFTYLMSMSKESVKQLWFNAHNK